MECHVRCHVVRRDSSAFKFDRVEIAFVVALFYWLNTTAMKVYSGVYGCSYVKGWASSARCVRGQKLSSPSS